MPHNVNEAGKVDGMDERTVGKKTHLTRRVDAGKKTSGRSRRVRISSGGG